MQPSTQPTPPNKTDAPAPFWGFALGKYGGAGLFLLFVGMGYMAVNGDEAHANNVYKRARAVSKAIPSQPVFVTGKLLSADIGSPHVAPGPYLQVEQRSEVYGWVELATGKDHALVCRLDWTDSPPEPSAFMDKSHHGEQRYKKEEADLQPVFPEDARVSQDGKEYKVDMREVELPSDMPFGPPKPEAVIPGAYKVKDMQGPETLVLYQTEECKSAPRGGCQRVLLSVRPKPAGDMTFIGSIQDGRISKFEETFKGSHGDLKELMGAYAISTGMDSFGLLVQRVLCVLGIWLGLGLLHQPLRRLLGFIPLLANSPAVRLSAIVTLLLAPLCYASSWLGLILMLVTVAALLVASRGTTRQAS